MKRMISCGLSLVAPPSMKGWVLLPEMALDEVV
jgi:hypothetical protein